MLDSVRRLFPVIINVTGVLLLLVGWLANILYIVFFCIVSIVMRIFSLLSSHSDILSLHRFLTVIIIIVILKNYAVCKVSCCAELQCYLTISLDVVFMCYGKK